MAKRPTRKPAAGNVSQLLNKVHSLESDRRDLLELVKALNTVLASLQADLEKMRQQLRETVGLDRFTQGRA